MQTTTLLMKIRVFFTKKKVIWTLVILLVLFLGWLLFGRKGSGTTIQTGTVTRQDIVKTVLTTGQVVSSTDLDLSFQGNGVVRNIRVKEGDQVYAGETLAVLDQQSALATLTSAKGSLAQAQANYNKILSAATTQDIAVSQANVDVAQTALENAKQNLLRDIVTAYQNVNSTVISNTNNLFSNPQSNNPQFGIPGTVQTNQQLVTAVGNERIAVNAALASWQSDIASTSEDNINQTVTNSISYITTVRLYMTDLLSLITTYTQTTSSGAQTTVSADQTAVSTAKATVDTTLNTITNDSQAVLTAQSSLTQAQASLALKQAPPRPEDVQIAQAQVLSAQGNVDAAQATVNNTVLVAPANGTITQVDIKLGEQAVSSKEVMKLQNVGELHAEANVSEADIANVQVGQSIDNTFDALGPDKHFTSKVLTVNPASTIISGVVDYKVTGSLDNIPEVKPGMTDNMTIQVAQKAGVLTVPSSAVINKDGKQTVKVIDDPKKKTYHEVDVTTGLEADGGVTEVLSGLTEGQTVVTYIK